jgi:NAD(P)-dependent dehydrogenase (short-subunit alcohol dehydrogenase family)
MKKFPRKRVVITGAGSGLGRAIALEFAKLNWKICVSDIDTQRAGETAELVSQSGGHPIILKCDVTRHEELEDMADALTKQWGGVDIVINNAGVAAAGFMEKITIDTWQWILDLNLKSVIYGCRTFIPLLEKQGRGYVVNVASCAGIASLPEMSCYNVTKAGVISLSETLRCELFPKNIGVTVVAPTFFKTNLMEQFTSPDQRQRKMADAFFNKSNTTSEDVARQTIRAIKKNKLYVIPQWDGKLLWICKRLAPQLTYNVLGIGYKYKLFDKFLGIA